MGMILKGDCIKVMKAMKPNSVDAIVCDPPYGLEFMGKEWDKLEPARNTQRWKGKERKLIGDGSGKGGNFAERFNEMPHYKPKRNPKCRKCGHYRYSGTPCNCENSDFDYRANEHNLYHQLWHIQWLTEAYRVLKPGGSMLVMGGTRTSHRLACAIEDSGFIIKDTLMWLYGSGFPKAQDLGKMIDKRNLYYYCWGNNSKRKTLKNRTCFILSVMKKNSVSIQFSDNGQKEVVSRRALRKITNDWDGFKVGGIKPAYEPIIWAVKPPEGSYVDNVLKWGVGAVNVDECRIGTNDKYNYKRCGGSSFGIEKGIDGTRENCKESHTKGRFPANVILSHHPECVQVGMKRVKTDCGKQETIRDSDKFDRTHAGGKGWRGKPENQKLRTHANADGYEQVESWDCIKGGIVETELVIFNGLTITPFDSIGQLFNLEYQLISHLQKLSDIPYNHNRDIYNLQDYENGCEVGLSKLPSFQACCQPCRHFYGELAQRVLVACQESSRQLYDVQKCVYSFLVLHAHSHLMKHSDHLSNYDDSFQIEPCQDTELNNIFGGLPSCEILAGRSFYKQDISGEDLKNAYNSNNKDENKKSVSSDRHKIFFDNICIDALCRLFFVLTYRVCSCYLPISIIPYGIELSSCAVRLLDEQSGNMKPSYRNGDRAIKGNNKIYGHYPNREEGWSAKGKGFSDNGGASRFFYCAKASRGERNAGLNDSLVNGKFVKGETSKKLASSRPSGILYNENEQAFSQEEINKNNHPTVKPIKLFEYLIKLVTRERQIILDPFIGSGTTAIAAHNVGRKCVGIEKEDEYLTIAKRRIDYWESQPKQMEMGL